MFLVEPSERNSLISEIYATEEKYLEAIKIVYEVQFDFPLLAKMYKEELVGERTLSLWQFISAHFMFFGVATQPTWIKGIKVFFSTFVYILKLINIDRKEL